ncbi:MAG: hypothetical protein ACHQ1G_11960 [Planctomycetota bacterium]
MILALLLLLAPEGTVEMKLRFEKGMVYEEASKRQVKFKAINQGHVARYDKEDEVVVRRTILAVGEDGLPAEESVEVLKSVATTREAPDDKTGETVRPSQGKTFMWRKGALYEGRKDVSLEHKDIVQRLRSLGSVRLPKGPVAPGATWEVPARDFEESDGREVPEGLEGKAVFKLEEVKDGVARITFEIKLAYSQGDRAFTNTGTGVWLFDVANGRELKLDGEGKLEVDEARGGFGTQKASRELTYR